MLAKGGDNVSHGENRSKFRKGTVSFFDKAFKYIYDGLKNGAVGALFTSYDSGDSGRSRSASKIKSAMSSAFDVGYTAKVSKKMSAAMLSVRLRVYGAFLATFGIYTLLFELFDNFLFGQERYVFDLFFGLILIFCSVPLIVSEKKLNEALLCSALGFLIKAPTVTNSDESGKRGIGRVSHGFIIGVAAGSIAYFSSPYKTVVAIIFLVLLWTVLSKPELGVVFISFLLPFITAKTAIFLLMVTVAAFAVKIIRGKRYACFETVDASVLGVVLTLFLGGLAAFSSGTYGESLTYVLLITVYFLSVNLLRTKAWLDYATVALVFGLSLSCLLSAAGYVCDITVGPVSSNLAGMFEGTLTKQLMLRDSQTASVVSIISIPLALSLFMRPAFKLAKGYVLAALALLVIPFISVGSVYGALAVAVAVLLLLLVYSRKSLYVVLAGTAVVSATALLLPNVFARASAYIGKELASSTLFREELWKNTLGVLSDFLFGGIGFGKECFSKISPMLSDAGANIPHTYNTYLQLWIETGIFGLIILLVFAWLLVSSSFTVFKRVDSARKNPALRTRGLRINNPDSLSSFASERRGTNIKLSVNQYGISRRIGAAAPLCSIVGMLVYGFFDYIWYDEKVFLMFWLTAGICSAYVRSARKEIEDIELSYLLREEGSGAWETDVN